MASPTSQEYIGSIAPKDKVALYMGYYFIAIALGNLFGNVLGGIVYGKLARDLGRPDLMWLVFGGMAIVTDAIGALGMPPGQYKLGDFTVNVDDVSVRLADGTLAGSKLCMDEAVRNLCTFTGCSLVDAVTSATATAAQVIGTHRKGALRKGTDADIVLLDSARHVMATIAKGVVVYSKLS